MSSGKNLTAVGDEATGRQQEVLDFIRKCCRQNGIPPTVRDIAEEFDIKSPNGVICHLKALRKKGLLTAHPKLSRGWIPKVAPGHCVACGQPIPE
jgi:repressor LexA